MKPFEPRLIFEASCAAGRKSATAAAVIATEDSATRSRTALRISSAVRTLTNSTPDGVGIEKPISPLMRITFRAPAMRCFGERVTHLAGRAIGEIANRIDIFASGPGGDQNCFCGEIAGNSENAEHGVRDCIDSRETARADHAAGEIAFIGRDDVNSARAQNF